ncbi:MAG: ABC transporter permease [Candidatus Tectomicrobia bacterium]|nr:ABC transporter permease [Candidatus Tectomicrobia bacterium]
MEFLWEAIVQALRLVAAGDRELLEVTVLSLQLSTAATLFASLLGVPLGFALAATRFRGRRLLLTMVNSLLGLPTVVIGLLGFAFLSRQGPLGAWGLLFTPTAIVLGGTVLSLPIIAALTASAVMGLDARVRDTALTLGAGRWAAVATLLAEARFAVMAALITGYGRLISEVGVSMILGGNIRGYTRTLTTAIALETSKGDFAFAMALGILLMAIVFSLNLLLGRLQGEGRGRRG